MKKKYIIPEALTINISMACPLATSEPDIDLNPGTDHVIGEDLDVKSFTNVNLWDNEW